MAAAMDALTVVGGDTHSCLLQRPSSSAASHAPGTPAGAWGTEERVGCGPGLGLGKSRESHKVSASFHSPTLLIQGPRAALLRGSFWMLVVPAKSSRAQPPEVCGKGSLPRGGLDWTTLGAVSWVLRATLFRAHGQCSRRGSNSTACSVQGQYRAQGRQAGPQGFPS